LAALLSPVLWRLNSPDRYDLYSVGIIFLQLLFAPLRSDNSLISFNKRFEELDWNLAAWREEMEQKRSSQYAEGFRLMDTENGAAWELAVGVCSFLICKSSISRVSLWPFDPFHIVSYKVGTSARFVSSSPWVTTRG
jgi:hypothetical protein